MTEMEEGNPIDASIFNMTNYVEDTKMVWNQSFTVEDNNALSKTTSPSLKHQKPTEAICWLGNNEDEML
jgi:hypothetical protein